MMLHMCNKFEILLSLTYKFLRGCTVKIYAFILVFLISFCTSLNADESENTQIKDIERNRGARIFLEGVIRRVYDENIIDIQLDRGEGETRRFRLAGDKHDSFILQFILVDRLVSCEALSGGNDNIEEVYCQLKIESDRLALSSINRFLEEFDIKHR